MKYAYSLKTERVKEPDFPYTGKKITCASDIANFVKYIEKSDIEKFVSIYLDADNKVIGIHITAGTINCAFPIAREIFKNALLFSAAAVILTHNHPSGKVVPSPEDKKFTSDVSTGGKIMGIKILDHIIIGDSQFFSFSEEGIL